ncbi:SubName: Full=Uncharacterized protein {ECO:0000313/EMBL:CCA68947.1} [Serendipita indica DSM 11827]|nr:SubName: Full=Uncharacterized protein {ECO:0000313/EMBL:CCA68947.1} [Serendipita indica DSM 11827]
MASSRITQDEFESAIRGFDALFSNDLDGATHVFRSNASPLHLLGLGATVFLQAALGLEANFIKQAADLLSQAESAISQRRKAAKSLASSSVGKSKENVIRFPVGTEWDILHADVVVLQGMVHTLSESYYGYLQALYALNSAHSKFVKLQKNIFPRGFDGHKPFIATTMKQSPDSSSPSTSAITSAPTPSRPSLPKAKSAPAASGLFTRLVGTQEKTITSTSSSSQGVVEEQPPNGYIEELVVCGAAFGFGLFNLIFSFLPAKARGLAGILGYKADRALALRSLAVSAAASSTDPHAVFSGNQRVYAVDSLLVFELAWILLAQARYKEAAEAFLRMLHVSSWSPATYTMLAAGCFLLAGGKDDAQLLLDQMPLNKSDKKGPGGPLPTEAYISYKMTTWKEKATRQKGETRLVDVIGVSPVDEMAIMWNNHHRADKSVITEKIGYLSSLQPPPSIQTLSTGESSQVQLDGEELASRSLLLGVFHGSLGAFSTARHFLEEATATHVDGPNSWVAPTAIYEQAILDLQETETQVSQLESNDPARRERWKTTFDRVIPRLERATALASNSTNLAARIESRVGMLKDEIASKRIALGI